MYLLDTNVVSELRRDLRSWLYGFSQTHGWAHRSVAKAADPAKAGSLGRRSPSWVPGQLSGRFISVLGADGVTTGALGVITVKYWRWHGHWTGQHSFYLRLGGLASLADEALATFAWREDLPSGESFRQKFEAGTGR